MIEKVHSEAAKGIAPFLDKVSGWKLSERVAYKNTKKCAHIKTRLSRRAKSIIRDEMAYEISDFLGTGQNFPGFGKNLSEKSLRPPFFSRKKVFAPLIFSEKVFAPVF